jgi:hypothetical protein
MNRITFKVTLDGVLEEVKENDCLSTETFPKNLNVTKNEIERILDSYDMFDVIWVDQLHEEDVNRTFPLDKLLNDFYLSGDDGWKGKEKRCTYMREDK